MTRNTMTRKHFERIAEALSSTRPRMEHHTTTASYDAAVQMWRDVTLAFVRMCSTTNDSFNQSKFLDACRYDVTFPPFDAKP
jgi:hypothetical protein